MSCFSLTCGWLLIVFCSKVCWVARRVLEIFSFHSVVAKAMTSSRNLSVPFVSTEKLLLPYLWDAEPSPWKLTGVQVWLSVDGGEYLKESLLSVVCSVGTLGALPSECLFLGVTTFEAEIKFGEQILWMILEKQSTCVITLRIWEGIFRGTPVQVLILRKTNTFSRVTTTLKCNYFWVIHFVFCCALFQQLKPRVWNSRVTAQSSQK